MELVPVSLEEANAFVERYHRHLGRVVGHKYSIGLEDGPLIGVIIVGRPVARGLDDGWTLEASRCCVLPDRRNGCSRLYAAAWNAARAMGYRRLVTYTLHTESGMSLKASGFRVVHQTRGGQWDTPARPRERRSEALAGQKTLWQLP